MKFSELLGEPEPERDRDLPDEAEPISVKAMSSRPSLCTTKSAARTTLSTPSCGPITPI